MYELGIPSLSIVYDMTWREFLLKKAGWLREQERRWEHTRLIAYWSADFDKSKIGIQKFMPLKNDKVKPVVSDASKDLFKQEMDNYLKQVNNGK